MPSSVQQSSAHTAWPGIGSGDQVLHMGTVRENLDGETSGLVQRGTSVGPPPPQNSRKASCAQASSQTRVKKRFLEIVP